MAADHQLRRERPGLAGDVGHVAHAHAGFLENLARDAFFDRFARLDEPGERRVAARWIARLAAEQEITVPLDQHDRHRVGAREVLRAAGPAIALPAALGERGRLAATGAEAVPGVPVEQAARAAV